VLCSLIPNKNTCNHFVKEVININVSITSCIPFYYLGSSPKLRESLFKKSTSFNDIT